MMRTLFALLLALTAVQLHAVEPEKDPPVETPKKKGGDPGLEGFKVTGLPLISFSTDDGFGYGVRAYGTYYEEGYAPFKFQAFAQYYKT
ncbi:MAG TPA: hypothetical protein PKK45_17435, partial [Leptospiraceae bacterium]|nr:hypothetical protein [Leptospiraceae bacterium]